MTLNPGDRQAPKFNSPCVIREHEKEVLKFDALSSSWWRDAKDPLYLMNSVRIPLLKSLARQIDFPDPQILDVGCGGGYLAEVIY